MKLLEQEEVQLPLTRLFNTAGAKVLDFLLTNEGLEYTKDEISELVTIPDRTLQRSLQLLLAEKIIKRSKKSGRVYHYTVNMSSLRVCGLLNYVNATLIFNLDHAINENNPKK